MNNVPRAVSFAAKMLRDGEYIGKAINVAANYYRVNRSDVQKGLASRSGKSRKGKHIIRPVEPCQWIENHGDRHCGKPAVHKMSVVWGKGFGGTEKWYYCDDCVNAIGKDHIEFARTCWMEREVFDYEIKWTAYKSTRS